MSVLSEPEFLELRQKALKHCPMWPKKPKKNGRFIDGQSLDPESIAILLQVGYFNWIHENQYLDCLENLNRYHDMTQDRIEWILRRQEVWYHILFLPLARRLMPDIRWQLQCINTRHSKHYIIADYYQRYIFDPVGWFDLESKFAPFQIGAEMAYSELIEENSGLKDVRLISFPMYHVKKAQAATEKTIQEIEWLSIKMSL